MLFVCENNLYAMGTVLDRSQAETHIERKAQSHRIEAEVVDGMDVLAVEVAARQAVAAIRAGEGPRFLECQTYRFRAHSMFDAQLYRDKAEVEAWKRKCPLLRFGHWLEEAGLLDAAGRARLETEIEAELTAAVACAEAGTWEPIEDLTKDVYTQESWA